MENKEVGDQLLETKSFQTEKKRDQSRDDGLSVLVKRFGSSSSMLTDLLKQRDSFGVAWLSAFVFEKNRTMGKIGLEAPHSLDLSEVAAHGIPREKVFLLLDFLPSSIYEMKVDGQVVQGPAFCLFTRFLKRLQSGREGGGFRAHLRKFTFVDHTIGPVEAPIVFPLLLSSLESLCLKGNTLGTEGFQALADEIAAGRASRLLLLDLQNTGLDMQRMEVLCQAMKGLSPHTDAQFIGQFPCRVPKGSSVS
uniref:Uncharacterized protein n=1 Tax=Chromera velia CCMP2878 TaxID=1169474 RepID=A0A0G4FBP2_9ALVE|eukprot:Cvel_16070.t1-p1 / transcript=Cvel_16070.t1 / gene=Cvel_16070 / organism=Chromera_velia_CCMP2878 / gene_product=hypothetical protein / transcript_product=hypothetical protein / location=Cvel_scaffold1221:44948-45694(+) / protein_length=249 / sequence_SO=supercontig / SO=protein_coding / is_pseudo=false